MYDLLLGKEEEVDKIFTLVQCHEELKDAVEIQRHYKNNIKYVYDNNLKIKFYYLRDKLKHPRITVCLLHKHDGEYFRGISVCSYREPVNKENGKDIALDRALFSYKFNVNFDKIKTKYCKKIIEDVSISTDLNEILNIKFKGEAQVELFPFEKRMLKIQ
jgi:hypothetical protein